MRYIVFFVVEYKGRLWYDMGRVDGVNSNLATAIRTVVVVVVLLQSFADGRGV